jgi:hypothetical protein
VYLVKNTIGAFLVFIWVFVLHIQRPVGAARPRGGKKDNRDEKTKSEKEEARRPNKSIPPPAHGIALIV